MVTQHRQIRSLLWFTGISAFIFVGLQLVRPQLANPPVTADLQAQQEVKQILRTSCYSCHSNETKLPWFDEIVPAYWLVTRDVSEARKRLNFSEAGAQPAASQRAVLFESVSQIELGAMPLPSYLRVHPDAAVTASQLAVLRAYLNPPTSTTAAAEADVQSAGKQYGDWIVAGDTPRHVDAAPNGITFLPDYKNWRAISSTDRSDNKTMRVILGNDTAIDAITANRINPWPDGTAFAKVAWLQQPDGKGLVQTGAFFQVEFMIKDSTKYASTKGWGWARWRGVDLKPYGTGPDFTDECVGCHTPVRDNDYVFTMPIQARQGGAK